MSKPDFYRRKRHYDPVMPLDVNQEVSWFDKIASRVEKFVSRAGFFLCCASAIILWGPSYWLFPDSNSWQLVINTGTTIITFLLVALLQNTQYRAGEATQHKLNAISAALAHVLAESEHADELGEDIDQLEAGVGLEDRETT